MRPNSRLHPEHLQYYASNEGLKIELMWGEKMISSNELYLENNLYKIRILF